MNLFIHFLEFLEYIIQTQFNTLFFHHFTKIYCYIERDVLIKTTVSCLKKH